jgi:hypothetical protein
MKLSRLRCVLNLPERFLPQNAEIPRGLILIIIYSQLSGGGCWSTGQKHLWHRAFGGLFGFLSLFCWTLVSCLGGWPALVETVLDHLRLIWKVRRRSIQAGKTQASHLSSSRCETRPRMRLRLPWAKRRSFCLPQMSCFQPMRGRASPSLSFLRVRKCRLTSQYC